MGILKNPYTCHIFFIHNTMPYTNLYLYLIAICYLHQSYLSIDMANLYDTHLRFLANNCLSCSRNICEPSHYLTEFIQ